MSLIYIAGPYTAATEKTVKANVRRAEEFGQQVLAIGLIPVIPHKITSHWDTWGILTNWPHDAWLDQFCLPLLSRCDGALFIPGWDESKGARKEWDFCLTKRIPKYYTVQELELAAWPV